MTERTLEELQREIDRQWKALVILHSYDRSTHSSPAQSLLLLNMATGHRKLANLLTMLARVRTEAE